MSPGWWDRLLARLSSVSRARDTIAAPPEHDETKTANSALGVAAEIEAAIVERRFEDVIRALRDGRGTCDEADRVEAVLARLPDLAPSPRDDDEPVGPPPMESETEAERRARVALAARSAASTRQPAVEQLLLLLAEILLDRGERRSACVVLGHARAPSALVLRADLLVEGVDGAPTRQELERALSLLTRALRSDIDADGAKDRWHRLRSRLGHGAEAQGPSVGATLVATSTSLPYVLRCEVARGGAGVVYEARERLAGAERTVALKIAHLRSTTRAQLTHEARVAVRFRGPGVVPIVDVDPDAGWLAMGWASGGSLRSRLGARRADDPLARTPQIWLGALLECLACVHRAGWIHGDIKPANVLFDERDTAVLGDFGLARACGDANTSGSAGYVSPERVAGSGCATHDDIFGFGRLLEDVLAAGWGAASEVALRTLATRCSAAASERPADADALLVLWPSTLGRR